MEFVLSLLLAQVANPVTRFAEVAIGASIPGVVAERSIDYELGEPGEEITVGHACLAAVIPGNAGNNWQARGYMFTRYEIRAYSNTGDDWYEPINGLSFSPNGEPGEPIATELRLQNLTRGTI